MNYERPSILPFSIVMRSACGLLGNPGIRSMSPAIATIISLPQFRMTSRMRMVKPSGEPYRVESAENENCVLAMQTG